MHILDRVRAVYDRDSLSSGVRELLEQEEIQGARMANRFRYIFTLLLAVSAYVNSGNLTTGIGWTINGLALAAYAAVTFAHTLVLRKDSHLALVIFSYVSLAADYLILFSALIAWYLITAPDQFAFVLKNPFHYYLFIPIATTLFQFRIKLVLFAFGAYMLVYFSLFAFGLAFMEIQYTTDWARYVLGPDLILEDVASTRPLLFTILTLSIGYTIYRAMFLTRKVGQIESQKQNLARYFSPDVAEEIASQPEVLNVGTRQKVTILFSDIRDFTAMSENLAPDEISVFLSELRRRLTNAIFAHGGTLDKYIGDAVMATFGTPRPNPEPGADSRSAVRAGLAMRRELEEYNRERALAGKPSIRIGIGLHTGEVFAGNVGFESRMEYTVIGDPVNTASRIESLCKQLDRDFLISRAVFEEAGQVARTETMPPVMVKGKTEPLDLYAVLGD